MSDSRIQTIQEVIKMTPKLNFECLNSIKILMEKAIDSELLRLDPKIILDNMDITEKVMYLDYLNENKEAKYEENENSISLEDALKKEGLTIEDLFNQD